MGCWHGLLPGAMCRFAYGPADAISTHYSLASVKSRLVLPFWYWLTWVVPEKGRWGVCVYFTIGRTCPTQKLPLPPGGLGPQANKWFLGPTRVHNPNGISISPVVFAGLTLVSNRQTHTHRHRPHYIHSNIGSRRGIVVSGHSSHERS